MSDMDKKAATQGQALENLAKAHERQTEAIREQYAHRIAILERERDSRLQSIDRTFESQKEAMMSVVNRSADEKQKATTH